jgi:hypothetical protein
MTSERIWRAACYQSSCGNKREKVKSASQLPDNLLVGTAPTLGGSDSGFELMVWGSPLGGNRALPDIRAGNIDIL